MFYSHLMSSLFFNILPNTDCITLSLFVRRSYFSKISIMSLKLRACRVRSVLMLTTKKDGVETRMTTDRRL